VELLLGCGAQRDRRIAVNGKKGWDRLVTLDMLPEHSPDVVHDLEMLPWPFADDTFDEVHAYEVLEHLGQQGDFRSYFAHFGELYRILKPGGAVALTCPSFRSVWAWGDPGHRRIISSGSLVFLDQEQYRLQVGRTPMADYRPFWKGDFRGVWAEEKGDNFYAVLEAVKPARLGLDTRELPAVVLAQT
jgi:hypothetical protein